MINNKSPNQAHNTVTLSDPPGASSDAVVVYVHAKGVPAATHEQLEGLSALGFPLLSRIPGEHVNSTRSGYDQPLQLLTEIADLFPQQAVIFLRAGLQPSRSQITQLMRMSASGVAGASNKKAAAFTVLSNAHTHVNPFAGLVQQTGTSKQTLSASDTAGLVSLLAPGQLHAINRWCDHFVLLPAATVKELLKTSVEGDLLQCLHAIDAQLLLHDHLFLHDPMSSLFEKLKLAPHETAAPPPFSLLSSRLQRWLHTNHPVQASSGLPATLHITHSWGGGVAQWLSSFISNDNTHEHYQLRSENVCSGQGYAQKLSLYQGNQLTCPVASWWLQPAIASIDICNAGYQQIVAEICRRYGISRIFVSSLVGHSLDALNTGLPTLQVLHDHFPVWPLLSVSPQAYVRDGENADLGLALTDHRRHLEFSDKSAAAWAAVRDAYLSLLKNNNIKLAAPGESVLRMQKRLLPAFAELPATVIPHAFPAMQSGPAVLPRPRKDGRLRLVILGRMQAGKGQQLLIEALPELSQHVQVYLLGTGKSGEQFFGLSGVNVVLQYQRDDLHELLNTIGPDFAALLSIVPETFSFTLSELRQMQIPVIATNVGSFSDRIRHGHDGWLIEPTAKALTAQVAELCAEPDNIHKARQQLAEVSVASDAAGVSAASADSADSADPVASMGLVDSAGATVSATTAAQMVVAYNRLCPPAGKTQRFSPSQTSLSENQMGAAAFGQTLLRNELAAQKDHNKALSQEVEQRTEWAQSIARQLQAEELRREKWVALLETEIEQLRLVVETSHLELEEKNTLLQQTINELQHVTEQNSRITGSLSWRITRPMRFTRRAMRNFMLARAWNPARWPWLLSQAIKNLSTLGLSGTLQRIQNTGTEPVPLPHSSDQLESVGNPDPPKAFQVHAQPDVSIVIPVYNKWAYTAACLRSLAETPSRYSFEVIVVDDQSSDETASYLAGIRGLKHLRNEQNLGFVGSCNRGASIATGEYIVMLNNDTQVLDG